MIKFEASGEFETCEDVCSELEIAIIQLREGYRGGYLTNLTWDISGHEEILCMECDQVIGEYDNLDPEGRYCDKCYRLQEDDK